MYDLKGIISEYQKEIKALEEAHWKEIRKHLKEQNRLTEEQVSFLCLKDIYYDGEEHSQVRQNIPRVYVSSLPSLEIQTN